MRWNLASLMVPLALVWMAGPSPGQVPAGAPLGALGQPGPQTFEPITRGLMPSSRLSSIPIARSPFA